MTTTTTTTALQAPPELIEVLDLGSDKAIRNEWFVKESFAHPAKLHLGFLQHLIDRYGLTGTRIIDPMGGIGSTLYAAALQCDVVLREVEPRWLALAHQNAARIYQRAGLLAGRMDIGQADAREPWGVQGDVVLFSPPYGCDTQHGEKRAQRLRERVDRLGDRLGKRWRQFAARADQQHGAGALFAFTYGKHPAQVGGYRGRRYWAAMKPIYRNARAALSQGGLMILVIKDHIWHGQQVRTCDQTVELCRSLGFRLRDRHARRVQLSQWLRRRAEKGLPVVDVEEAIVLETV